MKRCKGVLLAGMLMLSMSVPVYADKSVVVKVEAPADTTDYYMTVDSGGVGVDIYPSTDGKGEKLNDKTVRDGTVLHIEGETEKNGETWDIQSIMADTVMCRWRSCGPQRMRSWRRLESQGARRKRLLQ